jgi:hypothetical protein
MSRNKVFCVGLGKTGTTSLKAALGILGYRTIRLPLNWKGITDFDAALPGVSAAMYAELDQEFPGSKFLLTVRDVEGWLRSIERDMSRKQDIRRDRAADRNELLMRLYGRTTFDSDAFRQAYYDHEARVKHYFRERPDDLLVMNITTSAGWEPLCSFLDLPVPDAPFPFVNKAADLDELLMRLLHATRDIGAVAGISKYSRDYLGKLAQGRDLEAYNLEEPLLLKDDRRINKVIKRACAYFGGPEATAKALNLAESDIGQALERQREHARAKIRKGRLGARLKRLLHPDRG